MGCLRLVKRTRSSSGFGVSRYDLGPLITQMFLHLKNLGLEDEHGVAVTIKAVFLINSFGVKFL